MPPANEPVTMRGVTIILRNLEGRPGKYDKERKKRTFGVLLDPEVAEQMAADDWNIKYLEPRGEEGEETAEVPQAWLPIEAAYDRGRPPRVVLITSRGTQNLHEDTVSEIDVVDITNVDLIVNPRYYDVNGKTGIKAYLKSMYVTIEEDELELEYKMREEQRLAAEPEMS